MPVLPNRLRDDALRFVLVLADEKRPFEEGWQKTANYKHDHPRVIAHQGNLGVLTGGGLVVMDCDCREAERLARQLPETLVVGTSMTEDGFRKKHFYFRCPREKKNNPDGLQHSPWGNPGEGTTMPCTAKQTPPGDGL